MYIKKLRLSSIKRSKNDKIRSFFLAKSAFSFGSVEVAMGEDLVKSWYHLASRDVSEGYVHIKFEVSSLETKIEHCPDALLAISQKTDSKVCFTLRNTDH